MPAQTTKPASDPLAAFKVAAARRALYSPAEKSPRVAVGAISDSAVVTRGTQTKSGVPVLLVLDGSAQHALPLSAVGAAIAGGVITRDEINALLGS